MTDTDVAEDGQDLEAPEAELYDEYEALLHLSKHAETRRALPREQWTFREKANYYMDRMFLGVLVIFLIILLGECAYKMWYVSSVNKFPEFVSETVVFVFDWLFTQERHEELAEL